MKLYLVSDVIRVIKSSSMRLIGNSVWKKDMSIMRKTTVENPEGKRPFKRHRRTS